MSAIFLAITIWGSAPICAFDGYTAQCYYLTYEACEIAIKDRGNQRCIPNPS
jgi:hypothetical protein